jgi:hypothetical protein
MNYATNKEESIDLDQYINGMAEKTSGGNPKYWGEGDVNSETLSTFLNRIIGIYHQAEGGDKTRLDGYKPVPDVYHPPPPTPLALKRKPMILAFTGNPANHFDAFVVSEAAAAPAALQLSRQCDVPPTEPTQSPTKIPGDGWCFYKAILAALNNDGIQVFTEAKHDAGHASGSAQHARVHVPLDDIYAHVGPAASLHRRLGRGLPAC